MPKFELPLGGTPSKATPKGKKREERPILNGGVITEVENPLTGEKFKALVTTDSFIMCVIPVIGKSKGSFALTADALSALETSADGVIEFAKGSCKVNGVKFDAPEASYPKVEQIVDAAGNALTDENTAEQIGFNPEFLVRLCDALGCKKPGGIRMEWRSRLKPVTVQPLTGELAGSNAMGILMPIRLDV